MVVSGVRDYRVDYKSHQDWIIPKYAVLVLFSLGVVFLIIGIILAAVGGSSGLGSVGAVFLGLGLCLLVVCLLLCLHAYCVRYIRDQSTQTKDEVQVREGVLSAYPLVTTKPPQGVLKTGRSPVLSEPKRVRLQAERDTGLSAAQSHSQSQSGQTQSLSSQFLSEKFPLRTPDFKDDPHQTREKKLLSSASDSRDAGEHHYETLPLRTDQSASSFTGRLPGEVLTRSQEAEVSRQVSSTQVVYPQQVGPTQSALRFEPAQPPGHPLQPTNLGKQSTTTYTYRSGSPSVQQDYSRSSLTSPHPLASGSSQQTFEQKYQTSQYQTKSSQGQTQPRPTAMMQQFNYSPESRTTGSIQHYHVTSDARPIKIEQYYHTAPAGMTSQQRQMTQTYHWEGMGSPAGQDMSFEDHRSSKMSLYDNLNGYSEGGATI